MAEISKPSLGEILAAIPLPPGEPVKGKTYLADGWVYRDLPARLSNEMWDLLISIMGEGNYVILAESRGPDWRRGQFLISPTGMKNMKEHSRDK